MELLGITVQPEFNWSVLSVVLPWEEHDDVRQYMRKNPSDENQKNSWVIMSVQHSYNSGN